MKKVLVFGATIKLSFHNQTGIMKKVFAQSKVFSSAFDVYLWGFTEKEIIYIHNGEMVVVCSFSSKRERRKLYFKNISSFAISSKASVFYFRYASTDLYLLQTLKLFKKNNIRSFVEIPSYPYKGEFKDGIKKRLIYFLDCLLRNQLKNYVERIIIFVDEPKKIYGIECINTTNGIETESIPVVRAKSLESGVINCIAVASMLHHHGFDRMINGLAIYYSNKNPEIKVHFMLVGNGPELEKYKALTQKHNMNDYVTFYGQKSGSDLDSLFEEAHLAISSLGLHRIGLSKGSTLKNREYAVRGLPIVYSTSDSFLDNSKYSYLVSSDESPIDINCLINFFAKTQEDTSYSASIHTDAVSKCDMKYTMKPVVDYMLKE